MMQQYMKELEQEPFDAKEFVECLAWRTIAEIKQDGKGDFNASLLHESFIQAIKDLTLLQERQQKKCERLEAIVKEDEEIFCKKVQGFLDQNKQTINHFQELDGKINHVATKVLHLGDQLDSVNGPRSRVVEAQRLMTHLSEFISTGPLTSLLFTDPKRIDDAADVIQKLYLISQDLPSPKFDGVKRKIERKYDEIERALIEEFVNEQKVGNLKRMQEIAAVLSDFKNYTHCIDAFIEQSQEGCLLTKDVFTYLFKLCESSEEIIKKVFVNSEQVMAKFVLNIYQLKIAEFIAKNLDGTKDIYVYLCTLYDLYMKTNQLSTELSVFNFGTDSNYLEKLTNNIFNKYVDNYINLELKCLRERNSANLQKYYESKHHQKKPLQSGGFQDLRRDIQAVIGTRTNINIVQIENYGGETFLSEELAITILQDTKNAFQRCALLSKSEDKANNASQILDKLMNSLLIEHVDYALELGLQSVPVVEGSRSPPTIYFFTVVYHANNIIHLVEKQFSDIVTPLIINTLKYDDCIGRKKFILEDIEKKINIGLERSLNAITTWVKLYLQNEQKKNDFKPETDDFDTVASSACKQVSQYITGVIKEISDNLDGSRVNQVLQDLGLKLYKIVYDHMLQFQYNTAGAMVAICDLNEYRSFTKPLGPTTAEQFETLHALCNLLLVKPENLQQVCSEDSLVKLDKSILYNFIQLRSDFKSQKQHFFKT
ncbi:exocyst complex component 5 [Harmonia axyridis]|uniref:exocyst complex component 5 n=1 Tax=Harmonia axyridis TaxID=115357 RepID=UPI001E278C61|nr:exocyst complex component 5 [Harmonia axyridis]